MAKYSKYYAYDEDPPVEVVENLYRGPLPDDEILERFPQYGITKVITLCDERRAASFIKEQCRERNLEHHHIPLSPFVRPAQADIDRFLNLLEERQNGAIYTHCIHGKDRTGAMLGIFRLSMGWTIDQAMREMQAYRFGMEFDQLLHAVRQYQKQSRRK